MRLIVRFVAGVVSVAFLAIAVPFLALTTGHVLGGGAVASNTLVVFVAYLVVALALVAYWVRQFTGGRDRRRGPGAGST